MYPVAAYDKKGRVQAFSRRIKTHAFNTDLSP
jgi:hypothetical protein